MKQLMFLLFTLYFSFSINAQKVEDDKEIICYIPINPEFKGGNKALKAFLHKNLKYPPNNICVTGKVYIQFIVEKDGRITHPKILKSLAKAYDDEALRVIRLMPRWIPARDYGGKKAIASRFTLPIKFTVQD